MATSTKGVNNASKKIKLKLAISHIKVKQRATKQVSVEQKEATNISITSPPSYEKSVSVSLFFYLVLNTKWQSKLSKEAFWVGFFLNIL